MDNLKIVYSILSDVDKQMDKETFDKNFIESLKVNEKRLTKILKSLIEDKYLTGIKVQHSKTGDIIMYMDPRLTIKGMTFLQENSTMQKIKNGLKEIKEMTPFV